MSWLLQIFGIKREDDTARVRDEITAVLKDHKEALERSEDVDEEARRAAITLKLAAEALTTIIRGNGIRNGSDRDDG